MMRLYRVFKRYVYLRLKYMLTDMLAYRNGDSVLPNENMEHIGTIDQDGLIHCSHEYRDLFHPVNLYRGGDFIERGKFNINIIRIDQKLLIEKKYNGNTFSFYNEIFILDRLKDLEFVPEIHSISYKRKTLYIEYLDGAVLRERLTAMGAKIRDIDQTEEKLSFEQKAHRAKGYLRQAISAECINRIVECYDKIHARKIIAHDIKYGNIILCDDGPCLIDFETSIYFPELPGFLFRRLANIDKHKIETLFHG